MERVLQPSQQSAEGEEVSNVESRPSFQLFYGNFELIASQLTIPFLLALSEFRLHSIVSIKTDNGDGVTTLATVGRGEGGEQCRISPVIYVFLVQFRAICITTNLSISPRPFRIPSPFYCFYQNRQWRWCYNPRNSQPRGRR